MTDYSSATINTGNALASGLVVAVGAPRLENIVDLAALTKAGTVTDTSNGWTFAANSAVVLPDTPLSTFTIFVLAYADDASGALVTRTGGGGSYDQNYVLQLQSGVTPRGGFKQDADNAYPYFNASASGTNGVLMSAAFSYDGTTQRLYKDGSPSGSQSATTPKTSMSFPQTLIGATDNSARELSYGGNGIQLVLIWNRALSDAEQASIASNPDQVFNLSGGGGDVTAPTLTSATATATSGTTSSGSVSTNEANGTLYWLTNTSSTATATAVKAGSSQAVTATGTQSTTSTSLSPSTAYYTHFLHRDAAGNDSTVVSSASFTTPAVDTTPPTMNGSITVGAKTSGSISISYPAASDNVAVTGYEVSTNGSTWSDNGTSLSYTFLGLSALTSYMLYVRAYDAAGNRAATPLTVTTSTYRAGDTAANILANTGPVGGNPAGFLYAFASTVISTDWLSYTIVSGPTPAGGTLTANPDGTFTYFGPEPASLVIQPEVNGSNAAETITVTLYDQSPDTELPALTGSITVTSITSTGYNLSWPAGTDDTGVTGYEYSLNGGTSWTDNGNVTTKSITGRTPESTDQVQVRAYDAAGNKSTPALSTSVTLLAGPDVTAPLLSDPTAYASGPTTASGTVTTNEATGTLYFLRNNSATATDVAVKAGLSQAVTVAGIQTVDVTGLTASTPGNYIHYLHQDGSGNDSLVSSSAAFTTPAEPAPGVVSDEVGFRSCMRYPMESAIKGALA